MSVIIFLSCNSAGCDTILPVDAEDVISARIEARLKGWDTTRHYADGGPDTKWTTQDQCPPHRVGKGSNGPTDITRRFTAEECVLGRQCPALHADAAGERDVFHWCGHDQLGHRMANILIRDGYRDIPRVTGAGEADVLDVRGFGRMCFERWQAFRKADSDA